MANSRHGHDCVRMHTVTCDRSAWRTGCASGGSGMAGPCAHIPDASMPGQRVRDYRGRTLLTDVGQRCGCSVLFVAHLPTELVEVAADRMALPFATELCDQAVAHAGIKRRESHMHLRQRAHLWLHTCTLQAICVDGNNLVVVLMHEQQSSPARDVREQVRPQTWPSLLHRWSCGA